MRSRPNLSLALTAFAAAFGAAPLERSAVASGVVGGAFATGGGAPSLRVERFVVDGPFDARSTSSSGAILEAVPAAVVRFSARGTAGALELESDITFARESRERGSVRVMAVEELAADGAELTWREVSPGAGRSLHAQWREREDALDVVEWGNGPRLREELWSDEGALLPLYLLELLRQGRMTSGTVPCFEPLSRSIERYTITTSYAGDPGCGLEGALGERVVELVRTDGSLAGRYRFRGTRLSGFQMRAGGEWARAVDEAEYDAARARLDETGRARRDGPIEDLRAARLREL